MEPIDELLSAAREVDNALDAPNLEPNPDRTDFDLVRAQITRLEADFTQKVLRPLPDITAPLGGEDAAALRGLIARIAGELAALLSASKSTNARSLLLEAAGLEAKPGELRAAQADFPSFVQLVRGRWLVRRKRSGEADRCFKKVEAEAKDEVLKAAAKAARLGPRPITSAPPLFTLNGCGFRLYGDRDKRADGSVISTYCATVLFIPVFPISAYRIIDHGSGKYSFLAKERLSSFAKGFQAVVLASAVAFAGASAVTAHFDSAEYRAGQAYAAATALEQTGDEESARTHYEAIADEFSYLSEGKESTDAALRLALADVPSPMTLDKVAKAEELFGYYRRLPIFTREGKASERLATVIGDWLGALDQKGGEYEDARLRILDQAVETLPLAGRERFTKQRSELLVAMADALVEARPAEALAILVDLGDPKVLEAKGEKPLRALVARGPLLYNARVEAKAWLGAAAGSELAPEVEAVLAREKARVEAEERNQLFEAADAKRLERELKKSPDDQELAVWLASTFRNRGDLARAQKVIEELGPPGQVIPSAEHLRATLELDRGELAGSEAIWGRLLKVRLPRYRRAHQAYSEAAKRVQTSLIEDARAGRIPPDLETRLNAASEEEGRRMFSEWLGDELSKSPTLAAMAEGLEVHSGVVQAAMSLGMVRLRLANEKSGAERQRFLDGAADCFLAIRDEAEGVPSFHLGLGQVYHRLGRVEDGEIELQKVVDRGEPELTLAVAGVYRELGMIGRARDIAEHSVYDSAAEPLKSQAAELLALMGGTLSERERWLGQASPAVLPSIKINRIETRGQRLLQEGKLEEADQAFAEAETYYQRSMKHDAAAANNLSVALQNRYESTFDERHLSRALAALDASLRLSPDAPVTLSNRISVLGTKGTFEVVNATIKVAKLRATTSEISSLLDLLLRSPRADETRRQLKENSSTAHRLEAIRQLEVLAPKNPSGYAAEAEVLSNLRDQPGLLALKSRIDGAGALDTSITEDANRYQDDPAQLSEADTELDASIARGEAVLSALRKLAHPPTLAAGLWLQGRRVIQRAARKADPEAARQAITLYEESDRTWPELGAKASLAGALVELATLEALPKSPTLKRLWDQGHRTSGPFEIIARAQTEPAGAAEIATLTADASFKRGLALEHEVAIDSLDLRDLMLAKVVGDAALEAKVRSAPDLEIGRTTAETYAVLFPGHEAIQRWITDVRRTQ